MVHMHMLHCCACMGCASTFPATTFAHQDTNDIITCSPCRIMRMHTLRACMCMHVNVYVRVTGGGSGAGHPGLRKRSCAVPRSGSGAQRIPGRELNRLHSRHNTNPNTMAQRRRTSPTSTRAVCGHGCCPCDRVRGWDLPTSSVGVLDCCVLPGAPAARQASTIGIARARTLDSTVPAFADSALFSIDLTTVFMAAAMA